jgi:hypothetical protein
VIVLVLIAVALYQEWQKHRQAAGTVPAPGPPGRGVTPAGGLPVLAEKPQPRQITFQGCPPEGDGGDPELNRLKNRVDEGDYQPVSFESIADLPWPKSIERRDHDNWSAGVREEVARHEGTPVAVEGFVAGAKESGPESCNCHGADRELRDWHVWLAPSPGDDRTRSIVVETTPRVRVNHPGWTLKKLKAITRAGERVRISGWLMLDPEHPEQLGKTRGTLWEIHPVMRIEVREGGRWVSLDER